MLPVPDDVNVVGPWQVGVRTVTIGRLTAEVMYPAQAGSTEGKTAYRYDIRQWLPAPERTKVPDAHVPLVGPLQGEVYRDVPIDAEHGPYPAVIFMHGTSSFRIASGSLNYHWASRGFVVIAADYPGLFLGDTSSQLLFGGCTYPQSGPPDYHGDINTQAQALKNPTGQLSFLAGRVDGNRLAVSGHSVGGCTSANVINVPGVQVNIPLSSTAPVVASSSLKSSMLISGMADTVFGYDFGIGIGNIVCQANAGSVINAYNLSAGPPNVKKRVVGIAGGGHLVPTDLCQTNLQGRNAIQEAIFSGVCGGNFGLVPGLFDCGAPGFDWKVGVRAIAYASTAALEETLMCKDRNAAFATLRARVPAIGDFRETK
jgi:hypothetical protein